MVLDTRTTSSVATEKPTGTFDATLSGAKLDDAGLADAVLIGADMSSVISCPTWIVPS